MTSDKPPRSAKIVAQWITIPIVVLGLMGGLCARRLQSNPWNWTRVAQLIDRKQGVDLLFLGTSRVPSAIFETAAQNAAITLGFSPARVVVQGVGLSTLAEHYLALQNMAGSHPGFLQGATLFLEAPKGLPEFVPFGILEPTRWEGDWVNPARRALAFPLVRPAHFPLVWRSSMRFEEKAQLTAYSLLHWVTPFSNREKLHGGLQTTLRQFGKMTIGRLVSIAQGPPAALLDLPDDAGIRRDAEAVPVTLRTAENWTRDALVGQIPMGDWNHSVLAELMDFIEAQGGKVVFFEMPLHSIMHPPYQTPVRQQDRASFQAFASQRRTTILTPDFAATDADFPDYSHLRKSRRDEFTAKLIQAWVEWTRAHTPK